VFDAGLLVTISREVEPRLLYLLYIYKDNVAEEIVTLLPRADVSKRKMLLHRSEN